jgi:hypothetical protein
LSEVTHLQLTNGAATTLNFKETKNAPFRFILTTGNVVLTKVTCGPFSCGPEDFAGTEEGYTMPVWAVFPVQSLRMGGIDYHVYRFLNELHGQFTLQIKL